MDGEGEGEGLIGELGYHVRHLVDVYELDPRLEILVVVLPDELGVWGATEVGGDALVALLDENAASLDTEVGLVQAKLPAR